MQVLSVNPLSRVALLIAAIPAAAGCVSADKAGDEYPVVDVDDPDPEKDVGGPQFCNPTGKQGDELKKCLAHNETMYKEFDDEAKKREPWFNFTPDSWLDSQEVEEKFLLSVSRESEAVQKLDNVPFVELSPAEMEYFTGKPMNAKGLKPYLVRGLMYFKETGRFSVFEKDQSILVRHDSVGEDTPRETRSALVVLLGFTPKTLYVDCQVAE